MQVPQKWKGMLVKVIIIRIKYKSHKGSCVLVLFCWWGLSLWSYLGCSDTLCSCLWLTYYTQTGHMQVIIGKLISTPHDALWTYLTLARDCFSTARSGPLFSVKQSRCSLTLYPWSWYVTWYCFLLPSSTYLAKFRVTAPLHPLLTTYCYVKETKNLRNLFWHIIWSCFLCVFPNLL